jgi:hypothetical protein
MEILSFIALTNFETEFKGSSISLESPMDALNKLFDQGTSHI